MLWRIRSFRPALLWNNSGLDFLHLDVSQCAFRAFGVTMVSHCANPACDETFRYLGEGKLFLDDPSAGLQMSEQQLFEQCYWLCKECSRRYRLYFERGLPQLVSLALKRAAAL